MIIFDDLHNRCRPAACVNVSYYTLIIINYYSSIRLLLAEKSLISAARMAGATPFRVGGQPHVRLPWAHVRLGPLPWRQPMQCLLSLHPLRSHAQDVATSMLLSLRQRTKRRRPSLLIVLILAYWIAGAAAEALHYKVLWDVNSGLTAAQLPNRGLGPINEFPAAHAKVTANICGESISAGDTILASSLWSDIGATDASDPSCTASDAGRTFYAYASGSVNEAATGLLSTSSNSGYETVDAAVLFMVVDSAGNMYVVIVLDDKGGGGGALDLHITSADTDLAGKIAQSDNPNECKVRSTSDAIYRSTSNSHLGWSYTASKEIDCSWLYGNCCTDGVVLGPLATTGSTFDFRLASSTRRSPGTPFGISKFRVGNWDDSSNSLTFREFSFGSDGTDGTNFLFRIETYTRAAFCATYASCGTCSATDVCTWCNAACVDAATVASTNCAVE